MKRERETIKDAITGFSGFGSNSRNSLLSLQKKCLPLRFLVV